MAVPSVRTVGTAVFGTAGTLTPTVPTAQAGDLLICFIGSDANASVSPTHSMPSGWTLIGSVVSSGTVRSRTSAYWKRTNTGTESNPTVTVTPTGATACHHSAVIISYQNATLDGSSPVEAASTNSANSTNAVALTLTTTAANELGVAAAMHADNIATGATTATQAYTQRIATDNATGIDGFLYVGDRAASNGAGNGTTVTFTTGGTGVDVSGLVFAIKERVTWVPGSGHSYEQQPDFRPPVAPRCVALALAACAFVYAPPPAVPAPPLSWMPEFPDIHPAQMAPRRPVNEGGRFVEPVRPVYDNLKAVRFGATSGSDGLYQGSLAFTGNLYTVMTFFRPRVTGVGSGRQQCLTSVEANTGGAYNLVPEQTFNADTWESHDGVQGGFLFTDALTAGTWWVVAEVNNTGTPDTRLYWGKVGNGGALNSTSGNDHGSITATRFIVATDDAGATPNNPQNEWLDGDIAGIKIWAAELTDAELAAEKEQLRPVRTTNLAHFYDFQSIPGGGAVNTGGGFQDKSGNNADLVTLKGLFGFPATDGSWSVRSDGPDIPLGRFFAANEFPRSFFPDFIPQRQRSVALLGDEFVAPVAPVSAAAPFDPSTSLVDAEFPAFVRGPAPRLEGCKVDPLVPIAATYNAALFPAVEFPDFAGRTAPRPVALLGTGRGCGFCVAPDRQPEPPLEWLPRFPDFAPGPKRPNVGAAFFMPEQLPAREPRMAWLPTFPDFARAPQPLNVGPSFVAPVRQPVPTPFGVFFPDFPGRTSQPINVGPSFAAPARQPLPTPGWGADLPDLPIARQRAAQPVQLAFVPVVAAAPAVVPLSWAPVLVDQPGRSAPLPNRGPSLAFVVVVATPAPVTLGWLPSYPDQHTRVARQQQPSSVAFGGLYQPRLDWLPLAPDARSPDAPRQQPVGAAFVAVVAAAPPAFDPSTSLVWSPDFPDLHVRPVIPVNVGPILSIPGRADALQVHFVVVNPRNLVRVDPADANVVIASPNDAVIGG